MAKKRKRITRRQFLHQSAAAGAVVVGLGIYRMPAIGLAAKGERVLGANERINLGVIGCGRRGTALLRDLIDRSKKNGKVSVIAISDIYEPRKRRAKEISGAQVFHDYRKLLDLKDLDAVVIATPDHLHAQMSIDAMEAGKHVYCEKPMTHTWEEAKKVAQVQARTGRVFQVGAQGASDDCYWQARELIKGGAIGKLIWTQAGYFRNVPEGDWNYEMGPVDLENPNSPNYLDWKAFLGPAPQRPFEPERFFRYRKFWDYAGGIATDLLYHTLSHLTIALGAQFPKRVVAAGGNYVHHDREVPDTFHILIDYPPEEAFKEKDPASGHTVALFGTQENQTGLPTIIRGQEASLYFEDPGVVIRPEEPFKQKMLEKSTTAIFQGAEVIKGKTEKNQEVLREIKVSRRPRSDHMTNFLQSIRGNEKPHLDAQTGYRITVAICLAVLSYRENKVKIFDPEKEEVIN